MKYQNLFQFLAVEFNQAKIPFLLVGGFAVNYYRVSRMTGDVDLLMTEESFERAIPLLKQAGYNQVVKQNLFARFKQLSEPKFMELDILFVDQKTFKRLMGSAKDATIQENKFKVPSLEHLIALKLHSLKQNYTNRTIPDLIDIVNLIRINQVDTTTDGFRELCLKHGTQALYDEIQKAAGQWKN